MLNMELCKKYERRYTVARGALFLMVALTVINLAWILIRVNLTWALEYQNIAFVVSAAIPEILSVLGMLAYVLESPLYLQILCGAGVVLLLIAYLLCGLFSKKRSGWLIAAVVLYGFDYVVRLYLFAMDMYVPTDLLTIIIRIVVPTVIMVLLIRGVIAKKKLKQMI